MNTKKNQESHDKAKSFSLDIMDSQLKIIGELCDKRPKKPGRRISLSKIIQQVFKDYQQLHNIVPGSNYYLKELIYEERSCFSDEQERSFGQFNLGFCRYDTGDIF